MAYNNGIKGDGKKPPCLMPDVEAVEKVPTQILGPDVEKSDLIECATINDLMLGKGQVTPENHPLTIVKGFFDSLVGCKLMKPYIRIAIVLTVLFWGAVYVFPASAGAPSIYTLFFEPIPLNQNERIVKIDAELSCGHFSDFRKIPEDWSLKLTRPISGIERLNMEAGHGSSQLPSIQELNGVIGITKGVEPNCFSLNITATISVDVEMERKVSLKARLKQ